MTEIKQTSGANNSDALMTFTNLKQEFKNEWDRIAALSGWSSRKLRTDNKNLINSIANKIHSSQTNVLEKLEQQRRKNDHQEAIAPLQATADQQKIEFFKLSEEGVMTLTAATNLPKIHEVL
jgi:hypothetical protein